MPERHENREAVLKTAVEAYRQKKTTNISQLAREFEVPYHLLRGRILGRGTHKEAILPARVLTHNQEKALVHWLEMLHLLDIKPSPKKITATANRILQLAGSDRTIGHNWVYRFVQRLPPHLQYDFSGQKEKSKLQTDDDDIVFLSDGLEPESQPATD